MPWVFFDIKIHIKCPRGLTKLYPNSLFFYIKLQIIVCLHTIYILNLNTHSTMSFLKDEYLLQILMHIYQHITIRTLNEYFIFNHFFFLQFEHNFISLDYTWVIWIYIYFFFTSALHSRADTNFTFIFFLKCAAAQRTKFYFRTLNFNFYFFSHYYLQVISIQ